ncbi:hypothetical protein SDC49_16415 [Lactobacillus sp. R2/2]|nr:hypothetical protein [Lactobacillus sp. R2/2]
MEMVKQMDAGDIYAQEAIAIDENDTAGTLFEKLSLLGRDLLLKTLPQIIANPENKKAQDTSKVVFLLILAKSRSRSL